MIFSISFIFWDLSKRYANIESIQGHLFILGKSNNVNKSWMRFDMLLVWSQWWLLASQAVLENAWEQGDSLTR